MQRKQVMLGMLGMLKKNVIQYNVNYNHYMLLAAV